MITKVQKNIPALTGIRFFAAFAIVLLHSQNGYFFSESSITFYNFELAVPFFFALSGFVLTINGEKYKTTREFVVARIARIWPLHLMSLTVSIFIWRGLGYFSDNMAKFVLNAFLLQAWVPSVPVYFGFNSAAWSI